MVDKIPTGTFKDFVAPAETELSFFSGFSSSRPYQRLLQAGESSSFRRKLLIGGAVVVAAVTAVLVLVLTEESDSSATPAPTAAPTTTYLGAVVKVDLRAMVASAPTVSAVLDEVHYEVLAEPYCEYVHDRESTLGNDFYYLYNVSLLGLACEFVSPAVFVTVHLDKPLSAQSIVTSKTRFLQTIEVPLSDLHVNLSDTLVSFSFYENTAVESVFEDTHAPTATPLVYAEGNYVVDLERAFAAVLPENMTGPGKT